MVWDEAMIKRHKKIAKILCGIKDETFAFMRENQDTNEYAVQQFVMQRFTEKNLKTGYQELVVAFNKHSSIYHYTPPEKRSKKLENDTLVMLDIWARFNQKKAPYADITHMAYKGEKPPIGVQSVFDAVIEARDNAFQTIELMLEAGKVPRGDEVEAIAQGTLIKHGYKKGIQHMIGHPIGTCSPHGKGEWIDCLNNQELLLNVGYTIEPGLYFKGKFGVRCETDFYIDDNYRLVITTDLQKSLVKI